MGAQSTGGDSNRFVACCLLASGEQKSGSQPVGEEREMVLGGTLAIQSSDIDRVPMQINYCLVPGVCVYNNPKGFCIVLDTFCRPIHRCSNDVKAKTFRRITKTGLGNIHAAACPPNYPRERALLLLNDRATVRSRATPHLGWRAVVLVNAVAADDSAYEETEPKTFLFRAALNRGAAFLVGAGRSRPNWRSHMGFIPRSIECRMLAPPPEHADGGVQAVR